MGQGCRSPSCWGGPGRLYREEEREAEAWAWGRSSGALAAWMTPWVWPSLRASGTGLDIRGSWHRARGRTSTILVDVLKNVLL